MSSDSEMSIISTSSTDTEDKDNMEHECSDDEVHLSNVTPYQDVGIVSQETGAASVGN